MTKRVTLVSLLLLAFSLSANAALRDTVNVNIQNYNSEIGYFQKANYDLGDPRFMFSDPKSRFDFGIGGKLEVLGNCGFLGQVESYRFMPGLVSVPTDNYTTYSAKVFGSFLYFKARSYVGRHKMIAFIKLGANNTNNVTIKQAYVSFDGFSIGLLPTFFSDLEVGVKTSDAGLSDHVSKNNIIVGYTHRFKKGLELALSLEKSKVELKPAQKWAGSLESITQPLPDLCFHAKYRWDAGHIQLGFLARKLAYWSHLKGATMNVDGINGYDFGFGVNLSGNLCPKKNLKLSWQAIGGKGIGAFLPNINDLYLDLGYCDTPASDGLYRMKAIPVFGALASVQYNWSEKFFSSAVFSYMRSFHLAGVTPSDPFSSSLSALGNFFWNISDFAYCGIEYLFAFKSTYPDMMSAGYASNGRAHRLAVVLAYMF